ncbi:MAG: gas vesicle protein GvpO [Beijerinckiaceae bacterium]
MSKVQPKVEPMNTLKITVTAKAAVQEITGFKADAVTRCEQRDGGWFAIVDVLESKARVGDNDLISTYELIMDAAGDVTSYKRLRRYYRTERGAADAA